MYLIVTFTYSFLSNNLKIRINKAIIFPLVLHSCETWSLIFRNEGTLRVFQNSNLRRIFVPKRDENGLHIGELHGLYGSPNIVRVIKSRRLRWPGHVARMEEGRVL